LHRRALSDGAVVRVGAIAVLVGPVKGSEAPLTGPSRGGVTVAPKGDDSG